MLGAHVKHDNRGNALFCQPRYGRIIHCADRQTCSKQGGPKLFTAAGTAYINRIYFSLY